MKEIKYSDLIPLWKSAIKISKSGKIPIYKLVKYLELITKCNPQNGVGLDFVNNQNSRSYVNYILKALPENIITKQDRQSVTKNMRGSLLNYNLDNLYKFIRELKKVMKTLENKKTSLYVNEALPVLNYIYKSAYYEYQNSITHQVDDSKIAVSISVEDMRKQLLRDIRGKGYDYLKNILNERTESKLGLQLSSSPIIRSMLINAISNIEPKLTKKGEIIQYLSLIDDKKRTNNETPLEISNRIKTNTEFLLKAIKEEKRKMKDNILKRFLYYVQKVISLEYKNKNIIPKRRYYKSAKNMNDTLRNKKKSIAELFLGDSPKIEDIQQGKLGDCYLLSALMSIIKKNPKYIQKCFVNRDDYSEHISYVSVRLYKVEVSVKKKGNDILLYARPGQPMIIKVDNTVLLKGFKGKDGVSIEEKPLGNHTKALWVNFIEKAFNVYINTTGSITANDKDSQVLVDKFMKEEGHSMSGQNVTSGIEYIPLCAITGKPSKEIFIKYIINKDFSKIYEENKCNLIPPFNYKYMENKIFEYIYYNLKRGKELTASTSAFDGNHSKEGIYPLHAYSIEDAKVNEGEEEKYIVLKNPHMKKQLADPEITDPTAPIPQMKKGTVKLELRKFIECFDSINKVNFDKIVS